MNDLVRVDQHLPETAATIRAQVNRIQEVMNAVMKEGVHYGKIPGTPKPSLWKPGAEVLCVTFHIAPSFKIDDLSTEDAIRYRLTCIGTHQASGTVMGEGVGECSSNEEKYKWRRSTEAEFNATDFDRRRIKYGHNSQQDRDFEITQVRTEPADLANTILKMAAKRAHIAMTLNVLAASDIFTQDIEDLPEGLQPDAGVAGEPRATVRKPSAKKDKDKKPTATTAAAQTGTTAGAQASTAAAQTGTIEGAISEGQLRILKARIESAGVTDEQFKNKFGVALAALPTAKFNDAAAWIREMAEASGSAT